jgi:hypothetical protein
LKQVSLLVVFGNSMVVLEIVDDSEVIAGSTGTVWK